MSAKQPHEYDKRILVAVTGLTPQVVTETLYCLTVKRKLAGQEMFLPNKIVLLTTDAGRATVEETLTGGKRKLRQFAEHYGSGLGVHESAFERITEVARIVEAEDVHNTAESKVAADNIVNEIRKLIAADKDDKSAIVASIAGGRATMGYLLGYALSVFGRDQDRLTHVLVTEKDLEGAPEFFYPLPGNGEVAGHTAARYPGPEDVELTEVPFVPLRYLLKDKKTFRKLLNETREYSEIDRSIRELTAITVNLRSRTERVGCCVLGHA